MMPSHDNKNEVTKINELLRYASSNASNTAQLKKENQRKELSFRSPDFENKIGVNPGKIMAMEDTFALTNYSSPIETVTSPNNEQSHYENKNENVVTHQNRAQSKHVLERDQQHVRNETGNAFKMTPKDLNPSLSSSIAVSTKVSGFSWDNDLFSATVPHYTRAQENNSVQIEPEISKASKILDHKLSYDTKRPSLHINTESSSKSPPDQIFNRQPPISTVSNLSTPSFFRSNLNSQINKSKPKTFLHLRKSNQNHKSDTTLNSQSFSPTSMNVNSTATSILDQWRKERLMKKGIGQKHQSNKFNSSETVNTVESNKVVNTSDIQKDEILTQIKNSASQETNSNPNHNSINHSAKPIIETANNDYSLKRPSTTQHSRIEGSYTSLNNNIPFEFHQTTLDDTSLSEYDELKDKNNQKNLSTNTHAMQQQLMNLVNTLQTSLQKERSKANAHKLDIERLTEDLKHVRSDLDMEKIEKERIHKFMKLIVQGINDKANEIESICNDQNMSIEFETSSNKEDHVSLPIFQNSLEQFLQKTLSKLYTNITKSSKAMKKANIKSQSILTKAQQTKNQLETNTEKIKVLQKQISTLVSNKTLISDEIARLNTSKLELDEDCRSSQKLLQELSQQIISKEEQITYLEQEQSDYDTSINKQRQTIQLLHEENNELKGLIQDRKYDLSQLEQDINVKKELLLKCEEQCKQLVHESEMKMKNIAFAQKEAEKTAEEARTTKIQAAEKMAEVQALRSQCQEEYMDMMNSAEETKLNAEQNMEQALQAQKKVEEDIEDLNLKMEKFATEQEDARRLKAKLEEEILNIRSQKEEIQTQKLDLEKRYVDLKRSNEELMDRKKNIEKDEKAIRSIQEELLDTQNSQVEVEDAQRLQLQDIQKQKKDLDALSQLLKKEKDSLRIKQQKIEEDKKQLITMKEELDAFESDLEKKGQHFDQRDKNLTFAEEDQTRREKEIEQMLLDIDEKEKTLSETEKKIALNEEKITMKQEKLEKQVEKFEFDYQRLREQKIALGEDESKLEKEKEIIMIQRNELENKRAEMEQVQSKKFALNEKESERLSKFKDILDKKEETINISMKQLELRESQVNDGEKVISSEKEELSSKLIEISQLELELQTQKELFESKVQDWNSKVSDGEKKYSEERQATARMKKKRLAIESQFKKMQEDAKIIRANVEKKIDSAQAEISRLKLIINQNESKLSETEDRICQAQIKEKKQLQQMKIMTDEMNDQIMKLTEDKSDIENKISELSASLDQAKLEHERTTLNISKEQEDWEREKLKYEEDYNMMILSKQKDLEDDFNRLQENARLDIISMTDRLMDSFETMSTELNTKADKLYSLEEILSEVSKKIGEDQYSLQNEKAECEAQKSKLNTLFQRVGKSSEHDKLRIEKLELKLTSLQREIDDERKEQSKIRIEDIEKQRQSMAELRAQLEEEKQKSNIETRAELSREILSLKQEEKKLFEEIEKVQNSRKGERVMYEKEKLVHDEAMRSVNEELTRTKQSLLEKETHVKQIIQQHAEEIDRHNAIHLKYKENHLEIERELRSKLGHMMNDVDEKETGLKTMAKEIEEKRKDLIEKNQSIEQKLNSLQVEREDLRNKQTILEKKESKLFKSNEEMKEKEASLNKERTSIVLMSRTIALEKIITKPQKSKKDFLKMKAFYVWLLFVKKQNLTEQTDFYDKKIRAIENSQTRLTTESEQLWKMRENIQMQKEKILRDQEHEIHQAKLEIQKNRNGIQDMQRELEERIQNLREQEKEAIESKKSNKEMETKLLQKAEDLEDLKEKLNTQRTQLKDSKSQHQIDVESKMKDIERAKQQLDNDNLVLTKKMKDVDFRMQLLDKKELMIETQKKELIEAKKSIHLKDDLVSPRSDRWNDHEQYSATKLEGKESTLQKMEQDLKLRSKEVHEKEFNLNINMANLKENQNRVKELAFQLKEKNDDLTREKFMLEKRLKKCDECEEGLKLWEEQLKNTAAILKQREKDLTSFDKIGFGT